MSLRTMFRPERRYLIASVLASRFINLGKDPSQVRPKSILVIKLDEIGDMATAAHVFSMLKRDHPDARLTVLCKPFVAPLIEADPNVDHIMTSADGWTERYDVVVDLRGSWQTLRITLRQRPILRLDRAGVRHHRQDKSKFRSELSGILISRRDGRWFVKVPVQMP